MCSAVVEFKGQQQQQPVAFFNGTKPAPRHGANEQADMDESSLVTASAIGRVSKAVEHPITGTSEMEICCADAVNKEWMHRVHIFRLGWLRGEDACQGCKLPTATTGGEGPLAVEREALSTWNMVSEAQGLRTCIYSSACRHPAWLGKWYSSFQMLYWWLKCIPA